MHSRLKGFSINKQKIPKEAYITKTADFTSNAISFDELIGSKEQGDAEENLGIDDYEDIITKYKVHFQNEPNTYESSKVENVRVVHRSVSTESDNRDRKRKLNIEVKNPLISEKILKYRDLKPISKSCNLVPPPSPKSDSTSDTVTDKQDNKINRWNFKFVTKSKVDTATSKTCPRDYHDRSQISFYDEQSIPIYSTLYDSDSKKKSLLRTIRLQRLLNRLIVLKARQKKKLNWINFIKELKIKNQLMRDQNCEDEENEKQHIGDVTRPYRTNTTTNISNIQYTTKLTSKKTNPSLRNKTSEFRSPHIINTTTDINNFYKKYNIADTCKLETPLTKRNNNRSKFTTNIIDNFFNPEPRIESNSPHKFTRQDASFKFEKVKQAEENGRVCTYSTSSSNLSLATKKARRKLGLREKYSKTFFPKTSSSFSKSKRNCATITQRSYSFTHDGINLISTTSTQTESLFKLASERYKESCNHKSDKNQPLRIPEVSKKCILETNVFPQKLETQVMMEAKIDNILQIVNSLLAEMKIHKSKIIVAEKEASLNKTNIPKKQSNLNENEKNCERRYVLNEYNNELDFDHPYRWKNNQESDKYKSYPDFFALNTKDKCIELSKSLANSFKSARSSDDDLTDKTSLQENRITTINNNTKNFLSLVKTILPSPYDAIKKIISYVPSINYYNYLTLLPIPVTLMPKPYCYKYLCNLCGARFEKAAHLSRHIELNHLSKIRDCCVCRHVVDINKGKSGIFRCRYCRQIFTRAYCCELHQQSCAESMGIQHDINPSLLFLRYSLAKGE